MQRRRPISPGLSSASTAVGDDLPGVPRVRLETLLRRDARGRGGAGLGAVPGVRGWRRLPLEGGRAGSNVEQPEFFVADHVSDRHDRRTYSNGGEGPAANRRGPEKDRRYAAA